MTTSEPRYARAPGVLWRRVADEVVVLHPDAADVGLLSTAAAIVWEELDTPRALGDLSASLASAFDRDAAQMRGDLQGVLQDLSAAGLVSLVDGEERSDA